MKKDWFNGNIKSEYIDFVKFSLIFVLILSIAFCIFFILMGTLYSNISDISGRIFMCVLGGVVCLISFIWFILSIWSIRNYPKHKRLAHFFIKKYCFISSDEQ